MPQTDENITSLQTVINQTIVNEVMEHVHNLNAMHSIADSILELPYNTLSQLEDLRDALNSYSSLNLSRYTNILECLNNSHFDIRFTRRLQNAIINLITHSKYDYAFNQQTTMTEFLNQLNDKLSIK